jgi:hypothetical protein
MKFRMIISILVLFLPWPLRRAVLVHILGYKIHKTARIGYSIICPIRLEMGPGTLIGHLNFCRAGIELLQLREGGILGHMNWICGEPLRGDGLFAHQQDRHPELIIKEHAAITSRHLIDCTSSFVVGRFSTVAGWRSQILTHSIDIANGRQSSAPIHIGEYCFTGTNSVLLGGSSLPDYSVLGASSLLNKQHTEAYWFYAGVPAKQIKQLSPDLAYFTRSKGPAN